MVTLNRGKRLTSSINTKQLTSLSPQRRLLRSATILCLLLLSLSLQYRAKVVDLKLRLPDADAKLMEANSKMEEMQADASRQQPAATKQQQEVGQSQIQLSHASYMNRYPDEYEAVREYLHGHDSKNKASKYKLLSFGSATGEEAITLATMYYPDNGGGGDNTVIFGVDLHQESIDKARASWVAATTNNGGNIIPEGKVTFLNGKDTSISAHGLYDAIFANSVLCYHGTKGVNPESILKKYPFEQFESSLGYLDASLKVGGVLAIVNTNYHFSRSEISKRYTPLLAKCANFVPKVDAETVAYERSDNKNGMEDCVWVKKEANL